MTRLPYLKVLPTTTSFTVAILLITRALLDQELENDRKRSWRLRDWSRAFMQEHFLTTLAPGIVKNFVALSQVVSARAAKTDHRPSVTDDHPQTKL